MAIIESRNRNHVPRVHVYPHHEFNVLHAPEIGTGGHVHYLELDQFVGENFLVTVHGPLNPRVPLEAALRETNAVAARMDSGRLHPTSQSAMSGVDHLRLDVSHRRVSLLRAEEVAENGAARQSVVGA